MNTDTTTSDEVVTQCDWPGCPAGFTGTTPGTPGWLHIPLAPELVVRLCPFHARDHVPCVRPHGPGFRFACSCGQVPVRLPRTGVLVAAQDWRTHARDVNGPAQRDVCAVCLRDFTPRDDGMVRPHNALDTAQGLLLPRPCPGAGRAPREQVPR